MTDDGRPSESGIGRSQIIEAQRPVAYRSCEGRRPEELRGRFGRREEVVIGLCDDHHTLDRSTASYNHLRLVGKGTANNFAEGVFGVL